MLVALTDAEGDFASYSVDVLSISLERANGTRVEMLPASVRVDFAQLTSLSELISQSAVVPGDFVGGRIRLDYSDAEIYVEAGGALVPALVYDTDGALLTADTPASIVDVDISLPEPDRLIVTRGRTALLSIDFDLPAPPSLTESGPPRVYGIWEPGRVELFRDLADFVDELGLRLSAADRARSLAAYGRYSETGNELEVRKIVVHMLPAESP